MVIVLCRGTVAKSDQGLEDRMPVLTAFLVKNSPFEFGAWKSA